MERMLKNSKAIMLMCLLICFGMVSGVGALPIAPGSGTLNTSRWEGIQTSQSEIDAAINEILYDSPPDDNINNYLLYKSDAQGYKDGSLIPQIDSGSYMNWYTTEFISADDPEDANITWNGQPGDPYIGATAYLLVKDGNQSPAWYFFNLTALGWDGKETLEVENFWPGNGAISHVTLYGTAVPEPANMLLLGTALIGLAAIGRKKLFKK